MVAVIVACSQGMLPATPLLRQTKTLARRREEHHETVQLRRRERWKRSRTSETS